MSTLKYVFTCIAMCLFILFNIAMYITSIHYLKQVESGNYDKGETKESLCDTLKAPGNMFFAFCLAMSTILCFAIKTLNLWGCLWVIIITAILFTSASKCLNEISFRSSKSFEKVQSYLFTLFFYSITLASYILFSVFKIIR